MVVDEVSVLDLLELRRKAREHGGVAVPLVEPVNREGAGRADEHALRVELEARAVPEVASLRELNVLELVFGLNAVELFDAGGVEDAGAHWRGGAHLLLEAICVGQFFSAELL